MTKIQTIDPSLPVPKVFSNGDVRVLSSHYEEINNPEVLILVVTLLHDRQPRTVKANVLKPSIMQSEYFYNLLVKNGGRFSESFIWFVPWIEGAEPDEANITYQEL